MRRRYWGLVYQEAIHRVERAELFLNAVLLIISLVLFITGINVGASWLTVPAAIGVVLSVGYAAITVPARLHEGMRSQLNAERDLDAAMRTVSTYRMMLHAGVDMAKRDLRTLEEHDDSGPDGSDLRRKIDAFRRSMNTLESMDRSMWDGIKGGVVTSGYVHRLSSAYAGMSLGNTSKGWVSGQEIDAIIVAEEYVILLGTFLEELHTEQRGTQRA